MNDHIILRKDPHRRLTDKSIGLDPLVILSLLIKNWYWFLICLGMTLYGARWYIGHTLPSFLTSATILINETENRSLAGNEQILQGLGLPGGMQNLENQIMVLKSRGLTERTLKELPFEIEYYIKTRRNRLPIYPDYPIKLITESETPLPRNVEFSIIYLGDNMFKIESLTDYFPFERNASFGEDIEISDGYFRIECLSKEWFDNNNGVSLCFTIYSNTALISYYNNRLNVEAMTRGGSLLRVSLIGTSTTRDVDFLNKLLENFQAMSLEKKNREAQRRIEFIDAQLIGISDSLQLTENRLQQFRSSHRVMDISAQGQAIVNQLAVLESERTRLSLEATYYDYLSEYLATNLTEETPVIPITMGISDPGLTRLVDELADFQRQLLTRGAGEMNPLQKNIEQRVRSTKAALIETLNGLKRANTLARSENQESINRINSQASVLPATERQLLGIERKFQLNNELYTFLLETRAEQQMQRASNRADSEIIDHADVRFASVVSPSPIKAYFVGIVAGSGIPFIIIFLFFLFNKKLKLEDISNMTDIPIIGNIPRGTEETYKIVFDFPSSTVSESFRHLRSRLQFFTKEVSGAVILITSSMPGEGKTFNAINLASAYSLLGRKTILIGFDLRKPMIFEDFNLSNARGISTWLIGQDKFEDIIQETSYDNLSVISGGPVPPNPTELIALERTGELFRLLKEKFEYIIIDSAPLGVVSDTLLLSSFADTCLLVVRQGKTLKDMFELTLNEVTMNRLKGLGLILNDLKMKPKHYGYGDKFGYTNDRLNRNQRKLLKRRKAEQLSRIETRLIEL